MQFIGLKSALDRIKAYLDEQTPGVLPRTLTRGQPACKPPFAIDQHGGPSVRRNHIYGRDGKSVTTITLALRDHSDFASPQVVGGICKLTEGFSTARPGKGYYGKEKGWVDGNKVDLAADDKFRPYGSLLPASIGRAFGSSWESFCGAKRMTLREPLA